MRSTTSDYVFTHENGEPVHPEQVTKTMHRLVRQHSPQHPIRLHDLRHFRASALINSGADIAVVSKMMGHSSVQVTADIYGHLFDKTTQEMSEKAAALVQLHRRPGRQADPVGHKEAS